jgi:hypothetical protein
MSLLACLLLWGVLPTPASAFESTDAAAAGLYASVQAPSPVPVPGPAPVLIPRGILGPRGINGLKAAVATASAALLALGLVLDKRGRAAHLRRLRDGLLLALGLAGGLLWWNAFQFNFPGYGHASDTFHYYLGAKYFPELGYTRLYACTAVADREAGLRGPAIERPMRNLETNHLETTASILDDPARCTDHFSASRWTAFRHDVDWLRARVPLRRWQRFQQDHGYNATPAWGVLGRLVTSGGPIGARQIALLRLLDPVLLIVMWGFVVHAFGWRIACVASVYWGTNYLAPFSWTGGSILRQDWLAALVIGICLLRRERPLAAGALLGIAALLRVFPLLVPVGVALGALGRMWIQRRIALYPAQRRFAAGLALAVLAIVPLSAIATGGFGSWLEFVANSRVHLATPLANHVGLKTVLSYDRENRTERAGDASLADPMQAWKEARRSTFEGRRWLFAALVLLYALLVARAASTHPDWVGAVLGVTLVAVATELTGYYWSALLVLAFLMERRPVMGAALCALAAVGWWIGDHWHWTDQIHVWQSVAALAFCAFATRLLTEDSANAAPA